MREITASGPFMRSRYDGFLSFGVQSVKLITWGCHHHWQAMLGKHLNVSHAISYLGAGGGGPPPTQPAGCAAG